MESQLRPTLPPIQTCEPDPPNLETLALKSVRGLATTPFRHDGPLYPPTPSPYNSTAWIHDRTLLDKLDSRGSQRSLDDCSPNCRSGGLFPIAENTTGITRGMTALTINGSRTTLPRSSFPADVRSSRRLSHPQSRRRTLVDQNRGRLLSGMAQAQAAQMDAASEKQRRQSAPSIGIGAMMPVPDSLGRTFELASWGHIYFGDATTADVFVHAVAARRLSDTPEPAPSSASPVGELPGPGQESMFARSAHTITVRARVWPKLLESKPFLITRSFDIDELRASVPDPTQMSPSAQKIGLDRPPMPSIAAQQASPVQARRRSVGSNLRRAQSPLAAGHKFISGVEQRLHSRSTNAVPIRK